MQDFMFDPTEESPVIQEAAYNAASSRYADLFGAKFNSFNPEAIVSGGNNSLKAGQFDINVEDRLQTAGAGNRSEAGSFPGSELSRILLICPK